MRTIEIYLYPLLAAIYIALFVWSYHTFRDSSYWGTSWLLFLLIILIYENVVFTLGLFLPAGPTLETLHLLRFLLKVFLMPTLVFIAWDFLRRVQVEWSEYLSVRILFNGYTFLITVIGIFTEILWSPIHPVRQPSGLILYEPATSLFPYTSALIIIPLFMAGLYVWRKERHPILLASVVISSLVGFFSLLLSFTPLIALSKLILFGGLILTEWYLHYEEFI